MHLSPKPRRTVSNRLLILAYFFSLVALAVGASTAAGQTLVSPDRERELDHGSGGNVSEIFNGRTISC